MTSDITGVIISDSTFVGKMHAHTYIVNRLGRDVAGIVQDYMINDNRMCMAEIMHRMRVRTVWRITDMIKNEKVRWLLAFQNDWHDAPEVWPRVLAHIAILDRGDAYHLRLIEPGEAQYDIRTRKYQVSFTQPDRVFHEGKMDKPPMVKWLEEYAYISNNIAHITIPNV